MIVDVADRHPGNPGGHEPGALKISNKKSLAALEADHTDIYYLHAPDRNVPFIETLQAVNELYTEGKFKTFALSNFTAAEVSGD